MKHRPKNFLTTSAVQESEISYQRKFEQSIIRHCTPTLAGIKPANLFTCRDESVPGLRGNNPRPIDSQTHREEFSKALHITRDKLKPHGVCIEALAKRTTGTLLYVYRPDLLTESINQKKVATYLIQEGYDPANLATCIEHLHKRICGTDLVSQLSGSCSFPHEIGFFLGYPYNDVIGFIENRGQDFLCSGCWKVYSHERDAQECFCRYKTYTAAYEQRFKEGASLEQLAQLSSAS